MLWQALRICSMSLCRFCCSSVGKTWKEKCGEFPEETKGEGSASRGEDGENLDSGRHRRRSPGSPRAAGAADSGRLRCSLRPGPREPTPLVVTVVVERKPSMQSEKQQR